MDIGQGKECPGDFDGDLLVGIEGVKPDTGIAVPIMYIGPQIEFEKIG